MDLVHVLTAFFLHGDDNTYSSYLELLVNQPSTDPPTCPPQSKNINIIIIIMAKAAFNKKRTFFY